MAFLSGEPGIGKTRLLTEFAERARERGARILAGRCPEGIGALPYHPFAEAVEAALDGAPAPPALQRLLGDTGAPSSTPPLRPDEVRSRLLDAVARFVSSRCTDATVVLTVDDLHWADDGTVAMLRNVARQAAGQRLLVLGAYRDSELDEAHPLTDALGALFAETECSVLGLGGLDDEATRAFVSATAGAPVSAELVDALLAETRGNPFFTREIVTHLREDHCLATEADGTLAARLPLSSVPESVRQVIGRRRRRLAPTANRLLDVASVVDGPFPFEPVREAAGLSDTDGLLALDEVLHAQLVVPDTAPDRYDFTHALVRHTINRELNPARRLRLHRELAVTLAAARTTGVRITAAEVAIHYHQASSLPGTADGVAPALEAAGQAAATGAHNERAAFLGIALDLLPDDGRRAELLARRADALAWALRFDEAVACARGAVAAGAGPATRAEVAAVLATAGSSTHAWQLAAESASCVDDMDPVSAATVTLLDLERREAEDPDHPGMQLDLPGRREALRVLHLSGRLARRGDLARYALAAVHGRRERIPMEAAGDPTVAAFLVGDYVRAESLFARDADAAESAGQLAWAVYCRAGQARCQVALGALAHARASLDRSRGLVARLPGLALGWQLLHHEGAEDALTAAVDEGWPERMAAFARWMAPGPERHWGSAGILSIGARGWARVGRSDLALPLLARPVRALSLAEAWAPNYARTAHEVAETLWWLERRDHLAVVERALREKALPADFRFPMTDSRLALGRLCALDGRASDAAWWFDAARDVLDAQGALPLRAVVDHDHAVMHLRAGDRAAAARRADAAASEFERLGMTGWTRRLARSVHSR